MLRSRQPHNSGTLSSSAPCSSHRCYPPPHQGLCGLASALPHPSSGAGLHPSQDRGLLRPGGLALWQELEGAVLSPDPPGLALTSLISDLPSLGHVPPSLIFFCPTGPEGPSLLPSSTLCCPQTLG